MVYSRRAKWANSTVAEPFNSQKNGCIIQYEGILPICKPPSKTSFHLVSVLRKLTQIRTIGHAGTLDPFATGVMILLIGKRFTKKSNEFLTQDKEYLAKLKLGIATDTYDIDGQITQTSDVIPSPQAIEEALKHFQGTIEQIPPMFSAKKIQGKKLYELARKGISIERKPTLVTLQTELVEYTYPYLTLKINCSKGTYIRSLAHDLGALLTCGAHLHALTRTRSGTFTLQECCDGTKLFDPNYNWTDFLIR